MLVYPKKSRLTVLMLLLAIPVIASYSQTITSLVQPGISTQASRDSQFEKLVQQMDQRLQQNANDYEAQLLKGILTFHLGKPDTALDELTRLTHRAPEFHLAHLVRADLLAAKAGPVSDIGEPGLMSAISNKNNQNLGALREEVVARLRANLQNNHASRVPAQLLHLSHSMETALLVDKSSNRLYLYKRLGENQPPRLVKDFYVSTGQKKGNKNVKGDLKTPEGVYFITSWIPDGKLPEKYGIGAFQTNYPNVLDRKRGKTGDGIWLHGTDRIYYSRPPLDSEGCVVLSNIDLNAIKPLIKPGITPIVIADEIHWIDQSDWFAMRNQLLKTVESWRQDWESRDVEKYLSHYGKGFWNSKHNRASWDSYKRRISKQKTYQKVALEDLSLFFYPERAAGKEMVLVRFKQDYRSNNFSSEARKRLYLGKENAQWRILYEGQ